MNKIFLSVLLTFLCTTVRLTAVELVRDGKAVSEIVISKTAGPAVKTAAIELQRHLKKISGAELNIVSEASSRVKNHIYIGESEFAGKHGFKPSEIKKDGFNIIADDNYLILAGKDSYHYSKISLRFKGGDRRTFQKQWEEFCGRPWRQPSFHDTRDFNRDCGFDLLDATGSLYAVYAFLEQLGMRWYLPYEDIGIVYPKLKNISIKKQNIKREPVFSQRIFADGGKGQFTSEFLWMKSMGTGTSSAMPIYHSIGRLMDYPEKEPKEYFAVVNGRVNYKSPRLTSEVLRNDFLKYLEITDKFYPDIAYACIGQPDGWSVIDSRDAAAGWDRISSRGKAGRFSAYYWDFISNIRKKYMERSPDKKFSVFAYGVTNRAPEKLNKVPENVLVVFAESSQDWMLPRFKAQEQFREEWAKKINDKKQFMVWEYYTRHSQRYNFPPVPIIFTKALQRNFKWLYKNACGVLTESGWTVGKEREKVKLITPRIGISHLTLYLHSKLCWDKNLDMDKVLNEYYTLFFGPAKVEMKEFYEFAEKVWGRPVEKTISASGGFITREDVNEFFSILDSAKKKAGDSIYRKRIDLIASEMEPLKTLHDKLKRTGPKVRAYYAPSAPEIDGDLNKAFWTKTPHSFYQLKDMMTGSIPDHVKTETSFRWLKDNSALVIGVKCFEPRMNKLNESCTDRDSSAIFSDDNVEILIDTNGGIRPTIVINPAGTIYDHCITKNAEDLSSFYTVKKVAVKKYDTCWTVEILIDAKEISGDKPTTFYPWGINVCRQRMAGNTPEYYMLSPSGTKFNDARVMGNLYLRK